MPQLMLSPTGWQVARCPPIAIVHLPTHHLPDALSIFGLVHVMVYGISGVGGGATIRP
jgi:hypothetical protein